MPSPSRRRLRRWTPPHATGVVEGPAGGVADRGRADGRRQRDLAVWAPVVAQSPFIRPSPPQSSPGNNGAKWRHDFVSILTNWLCAGDVRQQLAARVAETACVRNKFLSPSFYLHDEQLNDGLNNELN